jgi:hypothetical protein
MNRDLSLTLEEKNNMAQGFIGKLFNISASGGAALVDEWIAENTFTEGSPAEAHTFFVGAPTIAIDNNIFQFVVLANANPGVNSTALGTTANSVTYLISSDGGAALITAMNNFANYAEGSPAATTTLVRSLTLTSFENQPMATVVMSN